MATATVIAPLTRRSSSLKLKRKTSDVSNLTAEAAIPLSLYFEFHFVEYIYQTRNGDICIANSPVYADMCQDVQQMLNLFSDFMYFRFISYVLIIFSSSVSLSMLAL